VKTVADNGTQLFSTSVEKLEATAAGTTGVEEDVLASIFAPHANNGDIKGFVANIRMKLIDRHVNLAALYGTIADLSAGLPFNVLAWVSRATMMVRVLVAMGAVRRKPMECRDSENTSAEDLPFVHA
jgi:hypothetical protein